MSVRYRTCCLTSVTSSPSREPQHVFGAHIQRGPHPQERRSREAHTDRRVGRRHRPARRCRSGSGHRKALERFRGALDHHQPLQRTQGCRPGDPRYAKCLCGVGRGQHASNVPAGNRAPGQVKCFPRRQEARPSSRCPGRSQDEHAAGTAES